MLELKPNCELCDKDLPPNSVEARICSYECTFCASCVEQTLHNVCPNCGGGFTARPMRPLQAHCDGVSLIDQPASTTRVTKQPNAEKLRELIQKLRNTPPEQR